MTPRRRNPFRPTTRPRLHPPGGPAEPDTGSVVRPDGRCAARPAARPVTRRVALLIAVFVALLAGAPALAALRAARESYAATHHQVIARVLDERAIVARVTWDGGRRSGWARRPLERVSDRTVRIWLDGRGRPAPRPVGAVEVVFGFLLAALPAGILAWLAVPAWHAWWLARRAVASWDQEWRDHRHPC
ncbi:hypothetical protein ABGB18_03670 [Nonomuraea sp. B12E4]|uniref:hypothetical protein n=1 Tax=Nonomuraea sp. B12E4 TaxID=3153564 RepID=UPI00325E8DF8